MSLVEILVGAFILATLAIVALPSMEGLIERQRTRAATYALLNNLALARLTAVSRRSIAALCPSTDGATCARSSDWSDGWLHLRASRTEPMIRVTSESASKQNAEERAVSAVRLLEQRL